MTPQLLGAFTRIREAAEAHMDERDREQLGWSEETVTEVCTHRGLPFVKVVPFNRAQEGKAVGADYLWWWLDRSSSVCFGMLVQAKRLTHERGKWKVDVRHKDGKQLDELCSTAARLDVPAMYSIYTGGRVFRADLPCVHDEHPDCLACRRMAVSMISAYQLDAVRSPVDTATMVLTESIPLEDLVDPDRPVGLVRDTNLTEIPYGPLREFMLRDQDGPLEIGRRIFNAVCKHRAGAFSAARADALPLPGSSLFPEVPDDPGHFRGSYYGHFLRGLRVSPPDYVREFLRRSAPGPDRMGYITSVPQPRPAGRPRALRDVAVDGVVLVTL